MITTSRFAAVCFGFFLFVSLGTVPTTFAQSKSLEGYQGRAIDKVEFQGLKRIEPDAVLEKIQSKKGSNFSSKTLAADIRAIFQMSFFEEVDVETDAPSDGKSPINLRFKIRERPVMSQIAFEGNEKVTTDDLKGVVKSKEWSILDINRLREDVSLIQKYYEDRGFYLAKVQYELQKVEDKPDEVKVTFKINDYDKVQIKKVTFLNNKIFSDEQLKKVLAETQEGSFFSFLSGSGSFKESSFQQDLQRLTLWYLDHGYVKFRYESPVVTVSEDKKWLYISIYVEEGEQYKVGDIDYSGELLFEKDELREQTKMKNGEIFSFSQRNGDIQRLTEKYQDLGYAFVNVIPNMNIHDDSKTVDINYSFEKGNLVYFGEIRVVGNTKTHDKVVRRELRVYEGKLYSGSGMRISRERVERLGFFQPGEVQFNQLTRKGRDDVVDIEIKVKERPTGTITLGAGYGSLQKFFISTQIAEINLFGRGQVVSFQGNYASDPRSKSFNLGFTDPYAFDTHWSLGADVYYVSYFIPGRYTLRRLGFDTRFGHPIWDDVNGYITYKYEGLRTVEKELNEIDSSQDEGILSSITGSIVRDKRNNRFEPTDGNYQSVSLEGAGVGGDKSFLKWTLNSRYYVPIVGDLIFRNNIEYGQMMGIGGRSVPPSERFFLGGPSNLKGFLPLSLAPKETILVNGTSTEVPLGGLVEMFAVFEFEFPLIREAGLKWVMFFDVGNSFSGFPGFDGVPFVLRRDAGFGFRWFSPIGPLRFEWGFPLDRRAGEDSSTFQFFIGPPF